MTTQKYQRVDITLPSDLLKKFEQYCEKEGMKISSRMAVLIRKDLKKGEKTTRFPKEGTIIICPDCKLQKLQFVIVDFPLWSCECGYEACPYTMKEFNLCECKNHQEK
jgi:metal-responsive CopG/Arc/MetJ family transcriptional regulator